MGGKREKITPHPVYIQGKAVISGLRSQSKSRDDLGQLRTRFLLERAERNFPTQDTIKTRNELGGHLLASLSLCSLCPERWHPCYSSVRGKGGKNPDSPGPHPKALFSALYYLSRQTRPHRHYSYPNPCYGDSLLK